RTRRSRSTCPRAAVRGPCAGAEGTAVDLASASASEPGEELLLYPGDLGAKLLRRADGTAAFPGLRDQRGDLAEDRLQLRVRLHRRPRGEVVRVPWAQGVLAQLPGLVEERADLVLVAAEDLPQRLLHDGALGRVAPEHVGEHEQIVFAHRVAAVQV